MKLPEAKARLRDSLLDKGLDDAQARTLAELLRPCLRFETVPTPDAEIPVGTSKFGGEPDLPEEFVWPVFRGVPLNFLAQLDLTGLSRYDDMETLPSEGVLSFFYGIDSDAFGGDPQDLGAWTVAWSPKERLVRRPSPPETAVEGYGECPPEGFRACRLRVWPGFSAPLDGEDLHLEPLDLSKEAMDAFYDVWTRFEDGPQIHQLLGYPIPVQGPMEEECQEGLEVWFDLGKSADPLAEWRLLLQIDSDEKVGMCWGDVGRVHFWIREADLAARAFDRVWMATHCH